MTAKADSSTTLKTKLPPAVPADEAPQPDVPGLDGTLVSEASDASFVAAIAEEYGQLVAAGPLQYFGSLAFSRGQAVPVGHPLVPMWLQDGSVVRVEGSR